VITRPAGQADALRALLQADGARVEHLPMLRIDPLAADEPALQAVKSYRQQLGDYQRVIFISTNAVRYGLRAFHLPAGQWPTAPAVYAIGRATAQALNEAGIAAEQAAGNMNSEALLALPGLQSVAGERILVVRGEGGRSHLADTLRARGATVDVAETYRRHCPAYDAQDIARCFVPLPDAAVVNSGETLKNLAVYVHGIAGIGRLPLVVPSARVASLAQSLGFTRLVMAANASDAAVVDALRTLNEPS
jgi:uroporphyrinogen-III synthase